MRAGAIWRPSCAHWSGEPLEAGAMVDVTGTLRGALGLGGLLVLVGFAILLSVRTGRSDG